MRISIVKKIHFLQERLKKYLVTVVEGEDIMLQIAMLRDILQDMNYIKINYEYIANTESIRSLCSCNLSIIFDISFENSLNSLNEY